LLKMIQKRYGSIGNRSIQVKSQKVSRHFGEMGQKGPNIVSLDISPTQALKMTTYQLKSTARLWHTTGKIRH
ncbi:hypothetical protein, partial [Haemophilus parainfluenzae]|uniref:hypothetical protein n=1 Tax=Haemophilus parainfluenzae TaxID=729 RepID=UPI001CEC8DA9